MRESFQLEVLLRGCIPVQGLLDSIFCIPLSALRLFHCIDEDYLSGLGTDDSDMDLFVEVGKVRESLEQCLEVLYAHLQKCHLFLPGTLTIVRGARVPIIEYIDSYGSGPQPLIPLHLTLPPCVPPPYLSIPVSPSLSPVIS
jgi:hypothetical protein